MRLRSANVVDVCGAVTAFTGYVQRLEHSAHATFTFAAAGTTTMADTRQALPLHWNEAPK